jgi:uncharacterized protein YbaR (Trm112 family)
LKRDLMDILACPVCKGELELKVDEENADEVVRGSLTCKQCGEVYPISDTIPDLRPPNLREGSGAEDFEDLDDWDDDEGNSMMPIVAGLLAVAFLIMVGLVVRSRATRS